MTLNVNSLLCYHAHCDKTAEATITPFSLQSSAIRGATTVSKYSLVQGITTLLQKKLDKSTQFGAVGYIFTLYSLKSYVKNWGSIQILGRSDPPTPSGCDHGYGNDQPSTSASSSSTAGTTSSCGVSELWYRLLAPSNSVR